MRHAFVLALAMAFAVVTAHAAAAQEWRQCASAHATGAVLNPSEVSPTGFHSACHDSVDGTDTVILGAGRCENIDIIHNADVDGATTDCTVQVMQCVLPVASTNNCTVMENTTLNGVAATSTDAIYGAAADWLYLVVTNSGPENCRTLVRCNP